MTKTHLPNLRIKTVQGTTLPQLNIEKFGWSDHFACRVTQDDVKKERRPYRVISEHRRRLVVSDGNSTFEIPHKGRWFHRDNTPQPKVGDWLVFNEGPPLDIRVLERTNELKRAVKNHRQLQTIVANVDLLFIVISCNADFTLSKLERYLALAELARIKSHVVLTKIDLEPDYMEYVKMARKVTYMTPISAINSYDSDTQHKIKRALQLGVTTVFVGSSGVGKSALTNTLIGDNVRRTNPVRHTDKKGRHTSSSRELLLTPAGGMIIDMPGIRELVLCGEPSPLPRTFPDIVELFRQCAFSNCSHGTEPHCQIQHALRNGTLERRRWENYQMIQSLLEDTRKLHNPSVLSSQFD